MWTGGDIKKGRYARFFNLSPGYRQNLRLTRHHRPFMNLSKCYESNFVTRLGNVPPYYTISPICPCLSTYIPYRGDLKLIDILIIVQQRLLIITTHIQFVQSLFAQFNHEFLCKFLESL